jgi:hypothetical protein
MEKMDSLVDLVRALAKKCEELENTRSRLEMYERWYKDQKEEPQGESDASLSCCYRFREVRILVHLLESAEQQLLHETTIALVDLGRTPTQQAHG